MELIKHQIMSRAVLAGALFACSLGVNAGEKEELLKLRYTTASLINQLVKQGVLTQDLAQQMIKQAETDAEQKVKQLAELDKVEPDVVRVPYVPEFVRDQIRQQVRAELREDVVSDVLTEAKTKQWGVPNALPDWTRRFKLYGDMRLRFEHDHFAESNFQNPLVSTSGSVNDYLGINKNNGFGSSSGLLNINKDRDRFRARIRMGVKAKITQGLDADVRVSTGNINDPVSTNQTLGNTGQRFEYAIDRAYLRYKDLDSDAYNWLTAWGGRIPNPFKSTNLMFDKDLSFEGFATTFKYNMASSDDLFGQEDQSKTLYLTLGAFPLEEFALSSKDKWLVAGQVGAEWELTNQDKFSLAVAYYNYLNTEARSAALGDASHACGNRDDDRDASVPEYLQQGNSMAPVCYASAVSTVTPQQFGLASEFEILNILAAYDFAMFAPIHVKLTGEYAKNFGFDRDDIAGRVNSAQIFNNPNLEDRTTAWQIRLDVGWPTTLLPGRWNAHVAYKYLESDAVLDAFTDSDFHLGGTNAEGWVIGGKYGLMENAWMSARWLSTDQIEGPNVGIDVLLVDFNAKF